MGTLIIDEQSYIIKKISTTIEGKHLILEFETSINETKKNLIKIKQSHTRFQRKQQKRQ